jgi:pilus assembly protein Flp/PilA
MRKHFTYLKNDRTGATAIEYGLIAALIAVATAGSVTTVGTKLTTLFTSVNTALTAATPAA